MQGLEILICNRNPGTLSCLRCVCIPFFRSRKFALSTPDHLFAVQEQFHKMNVAGSIPVSRSSFSSPLDKSPDLRQKALPNDRARV
jgi:hypothetical protein